jgi:hypothetical protein
MSDDGEFALVRVFGTEDHQAAYRVRNLLQAARIEALVAPTRQFLSAPGGASLFPEGPWSVLVPEPDGARAADLAERWQRRFGEA